MEGGIAPHTYCLPNLVTMHEEFEDTKRVIRIRKSKKDRQHNNPKKRPKGQTKIYKTLHSKLKLDEHELH